MPMQTVQRTVLCMGRKQEAVENVPCGNTVRLILTLRNCTTFTTLNAVLSSFTTLHCSVRANERKGYRLCPRGGFRSKALTVASMVEALYMARVPHGTPC